jgi:hypothetical protein
MWNTKTQIINKIQCGIQKHKSYIKFLCFCIPHWILFMICVFVFHIGFYWWFVFLYSTLDFVYDLCFCIPHWILFMICVLYSTLDFIDDLCFCIPHWILFMICVFVFHIGFYLWFVFLYSTLDYLGFVFLYSTLDFIYDLCFCIPHWILYMICVFVFHIQCGIQKHKSYIKSNVEYKNTNHI